MDNRTLLLVDDEKNILNSLKRLLRNEGYEIHCTTSAAEGLGIVEGKKIAVVVSDQMMPEMDGTTFLSRVRKIDAKTIRILLTGHGSLDDAIRAINQSNIFEYIEKPWDSERLKSSISKAFEFYEISFKNRQLTRLIKQQNGELKQINDTLEQLVRQRTSELEQAVHEGIKMLALAAEAKDDDTGDHILRIKMLTEKLCIHLGMSSKDTNEISFFSIMHDVGKIKIPDAILQKPGPLNREEKKIMMSHTIAGEKILGKTKFYKTARQIARSHHENWDGSGYPDGLKKEKIPIAARIVSAADVFDALINERPYKKAWKIKDAMIEINKLSGIKFDPAVVEAMNALHELGNNRMEN